MPRKDDVKTMFNEISGKYDFLNHFLSLGIDRLWRRRVAHEIRRHAGPRITDFRILDVATGTGDLAIAIARLSPASITGIDIAGEMLAVGQEKVTRKGLTTVISFLHADAEHIPFPDNSFDAVTVAFGVRNYENLELGLSEMRRVLRPGGLLLILEFSNSESFPVRQLYSVYSHFLIPFFGRMISGNAGAYTYLPESVAAFPSGPAFLAIMKGTGLQTLRRITLSGGIASVYAGNK